MLNFSNTALQGPGIGHSTTHNCNGPLTRFDFEAGTRDIPATGCARDSRPDPVDGDSPAGGSWPASRRARRLRRTGARPKSSLPVPGESVPQRFAKKRRGPGAPQSAPAKMSLRDNLPVTRQDGASLPAMRHFTPIWGEPRQVRRDCDQAPPSHQAPAASVLPSLRAGRRRADAPRPSRS